MDTRILKAVGVLVVLGGIVYVGVTWGLLPDSGIEGGPEGVNSTDGGSNGAASGGDGGDGTDSAPVGCGVEDVEESATNGSLGPPFDGRLAEAMVHESLNGLRDEGTNGSVGPLECSPELSRLAQEHSGAMLRSGTVAGDVSDGGVSARYEGVCDSPVEVRGRWLYQRDRNLNWDGPDLAQEDNIIQDHADLADDVREVWADRGRAVGALTDANATEQGVGIRYDGTSRVVYVTHVVC